MAQKITLRRTVPRLRRGNGFGYSPAEYEIYRDVELLGKVPCANGRRFAVIGEERVQPFDGKLASVRTEIDKRFGWGERGETDTVWIFTNDAFLSIVADATNPANLLVRGRFRGDVERFLPEARVTETPRRDYRYRTSAPYATVAAALLRSLGAVDYPNFKNSVPKRDRARHDAYLRVWEAMYVAQEDAHRPRRPRKRGAGTPVRHPRLEEAWWDDPRSFDRPPRTAEGYP